MEEWKRFNTQRPFTHTIFPFDLHHGTVSTEHTPFTTRNVVKANCTYIISVYCRQWLFGTKWKIFTTHTKGETLILWIRILIFDLTLLLCLTVLQWYFQSSWISCWFLLWFILYYVFFSVIALAYFFSLLHVLHIHILTFIPFRSCKAWSSCLLFLSVVQFFL